jgi:hypothetical protein
MKIREIGIFLLFKLPVPNKKRAKDIFSKIVFFETGPINSSIFYFVWTVDGGANAVFGPMAMILSATTDTFSD